MQESKYIFRVYHLEIFICAILAHTKWEAIERAMHQTEWRYERRNLSAKKVW
jgi:hypothetical protein